MISICIPVFNWNITRLVVELFRQAESLTIPFEMVIMDDDSRKDYQVINRNISHKAVYVQLNQNIGRSAIRNLFLTYTRYDNLLFLDCDSIITSNDFLRNYAGLLSNQNFGIVCGGRVYENLRPERKKFLRWKYGRVKESKPYNIRQGSPHKSFMTNNFLINRKILQAFPFDTRLVGYGHEDTLFGYLLGKNGIQIKHIDNPILNGGLESNEEYLHKTENGIINLIKILHYTGFDKDLINDVSVLRFYYSMKSNHLVPLIRMLFVMAKPLLKFLLSKGYFTLWIFDFYKFGILLQHISKIEARSNG